MKISLSETRPESIQADLIIIPLFGSENSPHESSKNPKLSQKSAKILKDLDVLFSGTIQRATKLHNYGAKEAERLDVRAPLLKKNKPYTQHLRLSGLGEKKDNLDLWRQMGGDIATVAEKEKYSSVAVAFEGVGSVTADILQALTQGLWLGQYRYSRFKKNPSKSLLKSVSLVNSGVKQKVFAQVAAQVAVEAKAIAAARDLVNAPPNIVTPKKIMLTAREIVKSSRRRLSLTILDKNRLKKLGANSLLAVAAGSSEPAYLLHLSYKPRKKSRNSQKIMLIGKGITFDSGGLSIKPARGMEDMKCDMAGAACVLAVMQTISQLPSELAPTCEIHALVPTCENMINGHATRPGDIVYAMNGKSIEILNTDAEGRLILADALSYAEKFQPDTILDFATLTGACIVALGSDYAGLFSNNDELARSLESSAKHSGELLWRLPLAKEYKRLMETPIADIKNSGAPGGPGAIYGALFLQEFVPKKTAWAHFDIAGPAYQDRATDYTPAGGTGYGIRTVLRFLQDA